MSQLTYNYDMVIAQRGMKADSGFDNVLSYNAEENVPFGMGLLQGVAENAAQLPKLNVAVLSFDADFVTGNNIDLDVNGVAITTVPFNTDQATTLADLVAELDSLDNISAEGTGAREVTLTGEGIAVVLANIAVTGGASQANGSVAYSTDKDFVGVALLDHAHEQDLDGNVFYKQYDAISVMSQGRVYVYVEQAVAVGDPVYLRVNQGGDADELPGQFRMDADGGDAILLSRVRWLKGAAADGFAVLEINLV
jgi:hypothetical protein